MSVDTEWTPSGHPGVHTSVSAPVRGLDGASCTTGLMLTCELLLTAHTHTHRPGWFDEVSNTIARGEQASFKFELNQRVYGLWRSYRHPEMGIDTSRERSGVQH